MIVAPQPLAAEEGSAVLAHGGNAVDAAVTTAFVQGVIDPQMCSIGGCGVMLVHDAATARNTALEFYARAGSGVREDQWEHLFLREAADRNSYVLGGWWNDVGYQSVGVPGTVRGLYEALDRFGTISWDQAIRPAIRYARQGFPVSGSVYEYWVRPGGPDTVPHGQRIQTTPEAKRLYTRGGELYRPGELLVQADYAHTLEQLAKEGPDLFYEGEIAERIAADFAAHGGTITLADLASYQVDVTAPLEGSYRQHRIVTVGPPAGGMTLLQMLNLLEGYPLAESGWPSLEAARLIVEAMGWAFADRERYLTDPRFVTVPVTQLTAKDYAREAQRRLNAGERFLGSAPPDSPTTTQVCVVDRRGNAVSLTHTLGSASGVVTPGLGFGYNNYLNCFDPRPGRPNSLAVGKTRPTMMTPCFAFHQDRLQVVIGAPGGTRIVGAILQTLLNLFDHGLEPLAAVSAPRVDAQAEIVQAEGRMPGWILEALQQQGYRVNRRPLNYDSYFANAQVIVVDEHGGLAGASDPRKDGGVALYQAD